MDAKRQVLLKTRMASGFLSIPGTPEIAEGFLLCIDFFYNRTARSGGERHPV